MFGKDWNFGAMLDQLDPDVSKAMGTEEKNQPREGKKGDKFKKNNEKSNQKRKQGNKQANMTQKLL